MKIVPGAVGKLLGKVGVQAADITTFCFPTAMRRVADGLAATLGLADDAVADNLQACCGETGTAHPLVLLVHALESASAGDRILVAGFGQGCDALLFEVTEAIDQLPDHIGISGHLTRKRDEDRYSRFLAFNDLITIARELSVRTCPTKN